MMAVPAGVKLDDGSGHFISNCFPVRHAFGVSDSAGAWLVAHRTEQIRQLSVPAVEPKTYAQLKYERRQREKQELRGQEGRMLYDEEDQSTTPGILDGFFLLKHCCVDDPTDLCSVNIAGQELTEANEEDFELFTNVAYVNAGENLLPFDAFNQFPIVRELELPLNGLRGINVKPDHFPFLEVLDLSHNNLSKEDVSSLGLLASLKVLYLTGNQLQSLPDEMTKPYKMHISETECSRTPRFSKLEILHLDDNLLNDLALFASLASLGKLRQLNLDKNHIVSVPHLQPVGSRLVAIQSTAGSPSSPRMGRLNSVKGKKKKGEAKKSQEGDDLHEGLPLATPPGSDTGKGTFSDASRLLANIEEEGELLDASEVLDGGDGDRPLPPFPELTHLSLAYNKIADEDSLLPVAAWPMLQELVIHHNPLTTQNSGDPPLLARYLTDRLGIRMIRKQVRAVPKPPVMIPKKPHRRVAEIVRPVPKKPLQLMLEGPTTRATRPAIRATSQTPPPRHSERPFGEEWTRPSSEPLPPIPPTVPGTGAPLDDRDAVLDERLERTKLWTEQSVGGRGENEDLATARKQQDKSSDEPVFLTQVDEQPEEEKLSQHQPQLHQPKPPEQAKHAEKTKIRRQRRADSAAYSMDVPQKFKGYEIFYNAPDDPDVYTAPDIQSNLRSLRLALNHASFLGENKVDLQKVQKPFHPYEKTKVPSKPPHKSKAERLGDALDAMRERETYVESNLGEILADEEKMREFPQVAKLLEEIQSKYSAVRNASVKAKRKDDAAMAGVLEDLDNLDRTLRTAGASRYAPSRAPLSRQPQAT